MDTAAKLGLEGKSELITVGDLVQILNNWQRFERALHLRASIKSASSRVVFLNGLN